MGITRLLVVVVVVVVTWGGGAKAQYPGQPSPGPPVEEYVTCAYNEECVYWQECYNGELNTGGIGLINVRSPVPIPSNVTDARPCQGIGQLCCRDPSKVDQVSDTCPLHYLCVADEQCINGEINTSGIGLIDQRVRLPPCVNKEYPTTSSVCCKRPSPLPLVTCANPEHVCRLPHECNAVSGTYEAAAQSCYADPASGVEGVCCAPAVLPQCSRGRVCVTHKQCTEQGTVNTDGSGIFDPRILDRCFLKDSTTGVCCTEPPPTIPPVEKCSQPNTVCSPTGYCDPASLSAPDGYTETCYRTAGSGTVGECCQQPPLLTCPNDHTCNLPHQCAETPANLVGKPSCKVNQELIGVCCTKKQDPVKVKDICPKDAVCLPEVLCKNYKTKESIESSCKLSGTGYSNAGVCCTTPITEVPGTAAAECGVSNSGELATRIKNTNLLNNQAKFGEFPWMAIVFFTNQTYKCGATVVDNRWVLTAAHCVAGYNPYDLRVRLGEYQVDLFDALYPYEDYNLLSITVHPKFNSANLHNNVAVLELERPITYRYHINRICLPTKDRIYPAGTECIATGWGKDAFDGGKFQVIMKKVTLPVVPNTNCQDMLRKTRLGLFFKLDPSFVCAGGKAGQDACTGDGGGPLMCRNPGSGRYELYGMTAWGIGCGIEGNPGVYVNVPYFMDWVYKVMQPTQEQQQQHSSGPYAN